MEFSKALQILLSLANRFPSVSIAAPPVVFVGGVGVGKSSVVEKLIGLRFLPPQTCRPLVIKVVGGQDEMFGEFRHIPGRHFALDDVTEQIIYDSKPAKGKDPLLEPIHLRLSVYHALNMTLVDLPGLPPNADGPLRDIVLQHIKPPSTIVVSVTAGDALLKKGASACKHNSVCLEVDPKGKRTINVLTRLDVLQPNQVKQLMHLRQKGMLFVLGNKLQSQHKDSDPIPNDTSQMIARINALAHWYVQAISSRIRTQLSVVQGQIENSIKLEDIDKDVFVINAIEEFARNYRGALELMPHISARQPAKLTLSGAACLGMYFENVFFPSMDALDVNKLIREFDVYTAIRNMQGASNTLFVPILLVRSIVQPLVKDHLAPPCYKCCDDISHELADVIEACKPQSLNSYPQLWEDMKGYVEELIRENLKSARAFVEGLVEIEVSHINIHHPDIYVGLFGVEKANRKKLKELKEAAAAARAAAASVTESESESDSSSDEEDVAPSVARGAVAATSKDKKPAVPPKSKDAKEKDSAKGKHKHKRGLLGRKGREKEAAKAAGRGAGAGKEDWEVVKSYSEQQMEKYKLEEEARKKKDEERQRLASIEREKALQIEQEKLKMRMMPEKVQLDVKDDSQGRVIEEYIMNYISIVIAKFRDCIPKGVMHFLVIETVKSVLVHVIFRMHHRCVTPLDTAGSDRESNLQKHRENLKILDVMRESLKEIETVKVASLLKGGADSDSLPSEPASPVEFADPDPAPAVHARAPSSSHLSADDGRGRRQRSPSPTPRRQRSPSPQPAPTRARPAEVPAPAIVPRVVEQQPPPPQPAPRRSPSPAVPSVKPVGPAAPPRRESAAVQQPSTPPKEEPPKAASQPASTSAPAHAPVQAAPSMAKPQPRRGVPMNQLKATSAGPPSESANPLFPTAVPVSVPITPMPAVSSIVASQRGSSASEPPAVAIEKASVRPASNSSGTGRSRGVPMNQLAAGGGGGGMKPGAEGANPLFPASSVGAGSSTSGGAGSGTAPISAAPTQKRTLSEQQRIRKAEYEERQRALRAQQMANRAGVGAPALKPMTIGGPGGAPSSNPLFPGAGGAARPPQPSPQSQAPTPAPLQPAAPSLPPRGAPEPPPRAGDKGKKAKGGLFSGGKGKKGKKE